MKSRPTKFIPVIILVALSVVLKWNWETALAKQKDHYQLHTVTLNIHLRSQMSQNLAVALLGGFRGSVADFIWLKAHDAWMDGIWYKLKEGIQLAVILQPKSIYFWDVGAWHMAYNASYGESENKKYPTEAYRIRAQRAWINDGKAFLEEGIRNNPDSWELHFRLAWLISDRNKYDDPIGSIPEFLKAYESEGAPSSRAQGSIPRDPSTTWHFPQHSVSSRKTWPEASILRESA